MRERIYTKRVPDLMPEPWGRMAGPKHIIRMLQADHVADGYVGGGSSLVEYQGRVDPYRKRVLRDASRKADFPP